MEIHKFSDIALSDPFFDSLKADYPGFSKWYEKKSVERNMPMPIAYLVRMN